MDLDATLTCANANEAASSPLGLYGKRGPRGGARGYTYIKGSAKELSLGNLMLRWRPVQVTASLCFLPPDLPERSTWAAHTTPKGRHQDQGEERPPRLVFRITQPDMAGGLRGWETKIDVWGTALACLPWLVVSAGWYA